MRMKLTTRVSRAFVLLAASSCLLAAERAHAAMIVSDSTTPSKGYYTGLLPGTADAGQFTLSGSATLNSAVATLFEGSDGPDSTYDEALSDFTATILSDNGSNSPGVTTYATSTGDSGTLSSSRNPITFNFNSTSLSPGT